MIEIRGDLWDYHDAGEWVAITTNGDVRRDGANVMGRGIALQAAQRFPDLPHELGWEILCHGNVPHAFSRYRVISFPVKHSWKDATASLDLIRQSAEDVLWFLQGRHGAPLFERLYLPRPGCGNGRLRWPDVRDVLALRFVDDDVVIVDHAA